MPAPAPKFPQWFCAQIGAREHYAVPQVLHQGGQLATLFTDFWAGPITRQLAQKTNSTIGRSLATRFHPGLADARVVSWNTQSLLEELAVRRQQKNNQPGGPYLGFIEVGKNFAARVQKKLQQQTDWEIR